MKGTRFILPFIPNRGIFKNIKKKKNKILQIFGLRTIFEQNQSKCIKSAAAAHAQL